jgi:hypothetical protein
MSAFSVRGALIKAPGRKLGFEPRRPPEKSLLLPPRGGSSCTPAPFFFSEKRPRRGSRPGEFGVFWGVDSSGPGCPFSGGSDRPKGAFRKAQSPPLRFRACFSVTGLGSEGFKTRGRIHGGHHLASWGSAACPRRPRRRPRRRSPRVLLHLHLQGAQAGPPGHWHLHQGHVDHELVHL